MIPIENLPDGIFHEDENPSFGGNALYTGERFFSRRPDDYRQCVALLAGGIGLLDIARMLKVHHRTVAAVRDREGVRIDILKERIRSNIRLAVGIAAERLPDIMAKLPDGQVPLSMAILLDKLQVLDGEPTQRIEVTQHVHLTHDSVTRNLTAFPDAIEIHASSTGLSGGSDGQKAALPASGATTDPVVDAGSSDIQSGSGTT